MKMKQFGQELSYDPSDYSAIELEMIVILDRYMKIFNKHYKEFKDNNNLRIDFIKNDYNHFHSDIKEYRKICTDALILAYIDYLVKTILQDLKEYMHSINLVEYNEIAEYLETNGWINE